MKQKDRKKVLARLLKAWNADPNQLFWGGLIEPDEREALKLPPGAVLIDNLYDPNKSYLCKLWLSIDIAEEYPFGYSAGSFISNIRPMYQDEVKFRSPVPESASDSV